MYFSIGAHPAFNCNLGDTLTFEHDETLYSERIDRDSVITGDKDLILQNSNKIEITEHLFDKDALIFPNVKSNYVILNEKGGQAHKVHVRRFSVPCNMGKAGCTLCLHRTVVRCKRLL